MSTNVLLTLPAFQAKIKQEFIKGSAIDPALMAGIEFCSDIEVDVTGDIVTPIHDALGWKYTRFGNQANATRYAAFLTQENGVVWQAKLSKPLIDRDKGTARKYETPKGAGIQPYLPPIPTEIRQKIAARNGVKIPLEGSFWDWVEDHPELPIVWTEGGKKSLASLSAGVVCIALYGVNGGYRSKDEDGEPVKPYLPPQIARFATPDRRHILAFDQDESAKTKQRVNAAIFQFGRLLTRSKGQVKIALWNGEDGKGIDDLIVNCGANAFHQAIKDAPLFEQWLVRQYSALSYPPALELNQRYLEGFTVPSDAEVVGLKAPKGTGKTEAIKRIVDRASQARKKVLVLVHRVQLVQSICDRVGLRSIYELLNSREAKDREQSSAISVEMDHIGYGLCIDSLHPNSQAKFNANDWDGATLVIDECEQVFKHLFNSSTCKGDRVSILQTLEALVQRIVNTGGQVILSDADLSDVSIDFVKGLSQCNIKPWIVVNNWKPQQPWQVTPYDSKEAWLLGIEAAIKAGDRVLVTVDSQKVKGRYSSYALEAVWSRSFPDKKILRIDSETLELKNHPAFGCIGSGLDEVLKQYDIVVCSPSVETGVSIDLKGHFNSVWGSFSGSIPVDSVSQALARLREPVPRHIYIASRGLHMIGRGETSTEALLKSENQLIKIKLHQLQDAANDGEIDLQFLDAAVQSWAKMAVRDNAGCAKYSESLLAKLSSEGHQIGDCISIDRELRSRISEDMTEARDRNQAERGGAITQALDLTQEEAEALESKRSKECEDQQLALAKFHLKQKYGVNVDPSLYLKDCEGFYPALQRHFYLTEGRQFLKERDKEKISKLTHEGKLWMPDANRATIVDQIKFLEFFNIPELLKLPELSKQTPLVQSIFERAQQFKNDLKVVFGFTADGREIGVIRQFLSEIGLTVEETRKKGERGKQIRHYRIVSNFEANKDEPIADGREEIFAVWADRHISRQQAEGSKPEASSKMYQSDTVVADGNKYIYFSATTNSATTETQPSPPYYKRESEAGIEPKEIADRLVQCESDDELKAAIEQFSVLPHDIKQAAWRMLKGHPVRQRVRVLT